MDSENPVLGSSRSSVVQRLKITDSIFNKSYFFETIFLSTFWDFLTLAGTKKKFARCIIPGLGAKLASG